jgi:hypothetical protein
MSCVVRSREPKVVTYAIGATDKKTDSSAYELHGLTEVGIEIAEGGEQ